MPFDYKGRHKVSVRFLVAGDKAISVEFGNVISLELNAKVRTLARNLKEHPIEGVTEMVPTYCSLIVHYRPEIIRYEALKEELESRLSEGAEAEPEKTYYKELPVLYGGELGEDLEYCAQLEDTTTNEIIRKHSQHEYYVYMLGFAPGHPYMARFAEPFSFKRRPEPRVKIPARSIVVQQNLSDVIPYSQPCGWNIIGSTPLDMCDFTKEDPFVLEAGDWIRHIPINAHEYELIRRDVENGTYTIKTEKRQPMQIAAQPEGR